MSESSTSKRGAVVVTGASTGIGRATAIHLARRGHRVFAGIRREEDAESIRAESVPGLEPVLLDVTSSAAIAAAAERVARAVGDAGLAGLVNNAGIALAAPIEHIPLDELRRQFEVNVFAPVAVTQAFLPLLRVARGRIVLVSSIGGRFTNPLIGPYVASKFALEAIADALRMEVAASGIEVSVVQPGAVRTAIWDKSKPYANEMLESLPEDGKRRYGRMAEAFLAAFAKVEANAIPAERVAEVIEHLLTARKPATRTVIGFDARIQAALAWTLPDRWKDALTFRMLGIGRGSAGPLAPERRSGENASS